jgi:hypothetical protein
VVEVGGDAVEDLGDLDLGRGDRNPAAGLEGDHDILDQTAKPAGLPCAGGQQLQFLRLQPVAS